MTVRASRSRLREPVSDSPSPCSPCDRVATSLRQARELPDTTPEIRRCGYGYARLCWGRASEGPQGQVHHPTLPKVSAVRPHPERPSGPVRNLTSRFRSPGLRSHFPKIAQCYTRRRVSPGVAAVRVAAVGVTGGSRASSFLRMCAGDRPVLDAAYILTLLDPLLSRRGGLDAFDG